MASLILFRGRLAAKLVEGAGAEGVGVQDLDRLGRNPWEISERFRPEFRRYDAPAKPGPQPILPKRQRNYPESDPLGDTRCIISEAN